MTSCLLIDESSVIRKVGGRILADLGAAMTDAGSGAEGLAAVRCGAPDIVIVAANLPDMAADAFVRALRAEPNGRSVTVLAMLVESNLGQMTRLKRAGANGFLHKPFDRACLKSWLADRIAPRSGAVAA